VGIQPFDHRLPADASTPEVQALIERLNADNAVSGILCQLPVPGHLDGVHLTARRRGPHDDRHVGPQHARGRRAGCVVAPFDEGARQP
jgi:hypothetical protein